MKTDTSKKKKILLTLLSLVIILVFLNIIVESDVYSRKEIVVEKSIEEVWEVMGNQYAQVDLWSTNFKSSKPGGAPKLTGLDYLHRVTQTERGETIQELDKFDPKNYTLSYHITKGAPSIAKKASAVWSLEIVEQNKTKVILEFKMETKGLLGLVMGSKIKNKIDAGSAEIGKELKYYVENGEPHPQKIEAQKKMSEPAS
jgi:hypothetical protein